MISILATAIIFTIFGVGDIIATKTKAIVSTLFFSSIVFLIGFWTGIFPSTMFIDSTILSVAGICVTMLLVHLGTIIKLEDFVKQWKTVIVASAACMGVSIGVYFIGSLFINRIFALVGAPILSGGVVATLIMSKIATDAGLPDLAVFATLVMVSQGFIGYPVASLCLKSEAKRLINLNAEGKLAASEELDLKINSRRKLSPEISTKYNGSNVIIARIAIVAVLATYLTSLINSLLVGVTGRENFLSALVVCLILGLLGKEIGFLEEDGLGKADAIGFIMPVVTLSIFTNLANATPQMVLKMLWPLIVVLIVGTVSFVVISILVGKIFKYSWQMSVAISSTCLFGFPGTYIISKEIANSYGKTEEERKLILDRIMPDMLIAGMVTVSITSVLIAGIMSGIL